MRWLIPLVLLSSLLDSTSAVKHEDFKTCSQSSFCRRLRSIGSKQLASTGFTSPYTLGAPTSDEGSGSWKWPLKSTLYPEISFELQVDILDIGIPRIRVDEIGSTTPFKRYNETAKWVLLNTAPPLDSSAQAATHNGVTTIKYGKGTTLEIQHSPFKITSLRDGKPEMIINDRSLFHMEHFRVKNLEAAEELLSEGEQLVVQPDRSWFEESDHELFEEKFKKWTDSKPKGPEALSLDITFPGVRDIYGLPEHASPLSLPDTIGDSPRYTEPYRLFNVDIFEYLADSSMSLYGAIPLLHAHSSTHSIGLLNLVASETWVDVHHTTQSVETHWMSESGILDILILPGPRPDDLFKQYAALTGPTPLPPKWSIAYHQCRWNYVDEEDVLEVDRRFDEADIPLDITWLDIEYAAEHRYFDWDEKVFPDPVRMLNKVAEKGRKMVAIVDPHIKKTDSFRIYKDAKDLDILMKKADGSELDGWCWTGSSVWVDFFNPKSWDWWTRMFSFDVWKESAPNLFIWNDMNEPSVFDGPEITVPKDTIHHGGWENRDVHNLNGMMFHNQTAQALVARESPKKRPFVLSRAFFAGSHRYGAIWTGDNMGTWDHFAGQTAMLLSNNIAGMSFSGADVGGFFGNPSPELLVRWYQSGIFMPFFRAHAHIDTKRREPYLYEEPIRGYIRDTIRLRYQVLSIWYNAFHDASITGAPIIRPQYAVFPSDKKGFTIDDQYYVGDSGLLIKPVTQEGSTSTKIYVADAQPYYDYFTHHLYPSSAGQEITFDTPLDKYPVFIQGGSILPIRQRIRRSSPLMWQDPFTLVIALSKEGYAKGQLYLDDGVGYGYEQGEYVWRGFEFSNGILRSTNKGTGQSDVEGESRVTPYDDGNMWAKSVAHVGIERIIILGLKGKPNSVKVKGEEVVWSWEDGAGAAGKKEGRASRLAMKNPGLGVVAGWEVVLE